MLNALLTALMRGVFLLSAGVLALGLLALGLMLGLAVWAIWSVRRLFARLRGQPMPQRPAMRTWRGVRAPQPSGEVIDVQARELP